MLDVPPRARLRLLKRNLQHALTHPMSNCGKQVLKEPFLMDASSSNFIRGSGVLLHITSLPSEHGIGDLGPQAYRFADMLHKAQQRYWQVLPLNPTQEGGCNSPYFSASSSAGNPLLVSLELLEREGWWKLDECAPETASASEVDFHAVTEFKYRQLAAAFRVFKKRDDHEVFERFCMQQRHWLDDYALFITLKAAFGGKVWSEWPESLRVREKKSVNKVRKEFEEAILREKWYQYVFFSQWNAFKEYCNGLGIRLIGDIPIYVSYDSVDVWAHPEMYKLNSRLEPVGVSGVPPDYFSATGQLWNNPVYNWDKHRETGFAWWIDRMKLMLGRFDIVRVDHFRGLVQYWEVPAGEKTAINGTWMPVPTYAFFDALKAVVSPLSVIAEDLGIITDDVKEAMCHYEFPGMKVLLFAFGEDDPSHPYLPHTYPRNCIVYTGTHDNNTVRGWYENEADETVRQRLRTYLGCIGNSVEDIVWALIRLALGSVADCAVIAAQDLLVLDGSCRMNTPSVAHGNWRWRMTPGQMDAFPVDALAAMTRMYGRGAHPKR